MLRVPFVSGFFVCAGIAGTACTACHMGNIVGSERTKLATMTVAGEAGVQVRDIEVAVLEIRSDDGKTTRKTYNLAFDVEGDALAAFVPGFRYACAVPDAVLAEGHRYWGNTAVDGKLRPDMMLVSLDEHARSTGAPEPSACEFELRLRERDAIGPPPAKVTERPIGTLCYRRTGETRELSDGACPEGLLARKPGGETTLTAKFSAARTGVPQPGGGSSVMFGALLTVQREIAGGPFAVALAADCDGKTGAVRLGHNHFDGVLPGESIWYDGSLLAPDVLAAEPKQCEVTVHLEQGGAPVELTRACYTGGALGDGACR